MRTLALVAMMLLAAVAQGGLKHFFDRPVFVYMRHPELPLDEFSGGRLGIPEPTWARIYHYVVYRELNGRPLTAAERAAWARVVRMRGGWDIESAPGVWKKVPPKETFWPDEAKPGREEWKRVRGQVTTVKAPGEPGKTQRRDTWAFTSAENCSGDTYRTAASALEERIRRYGVASGEVKFWTEGQDLVIAACAETGTAIPQVAPAGMVAALRADRDYQIGAALFNGMRLEEAIPVFERVAKDASSPWRVWAPYMVGRSWLWRARVTQSREDRQQFLIRAERAFRAVLADRGLAVSHAAAERMLVRCLLVTNRKEALMRLGTRLARTRQEAPEWELRHYFGGMDDVEPDAPDRPTDDLSRWLMAAKDRSPQVGTLAAAEWRRTRSPAWLLIAVDRAEGGVDRELMAAAAVSKVMGIRFHHARLLAAQGEWEAGRRVLAEIDQEARGRFSTRNRILTLRCQLAVDEAEFLRLAPRVVVRRGNETDDSEFHQREALPGSELPWWDETSETILTRRIPLEKLAAWAGSGSVPKHLQEEMRRVVWVRAVLMGRKAIAERFGEAGSEAAIARAILRLPGARPFVSRGYPRRMLKPEGFDEWGQNWWYRLTEEEMHSAGWRTWHTDARARLLPRFPFLGEGEERQAAAEWASLQKVPRGLEWIGQRIVPWAEANPRDPEAPAELTRLVEGSMLIFWAHNISLTEEPSLKRAFRLMETRYRATPWYRRLEGWPVRTREPE